MKKTKLNLLNYFAFESTPGWKLDDNGNVVLKDGNPVLMTASGEEKVVEPSTITRLNAESKGHREAKEAALKQLKDFEGIDPVLAKKSIETVKKLDAKDLIESGKVEELKQQITSQFAEKISEKEKALSELQTKYDNMQIRSVFEGSNFVKESITMPADIFQAAFEKSFRVENGEVVAVDKNGERLMSKSKVGEWASPEEALQILVERHPQKDLILKADLGNGTGNKGGGGNRTSQGKITRSAFEAANNKPEILAKQRAGEIQIVD